MPLAVKKHHMKNSVNEYEMKKSAVFTNGEVNLGSLGKVFKLNKKRGDFFKIFEEYTPLVSTCLHPCLPACLPDCLLA